MLTFGGGFWGNKSDLILLWFKSRVIFGVVEKLFGEVEKV